MKPRFFATPDEFRDWLAKHHASATELVVGFHKKNSGKPGMDWPQSVDEALCYGWIDGVRRRLDDTRYTIRFTPRRRGSIWSAVNIRRVGVLKRLGRMQPAGLAAFERRTHKRSAVYAYEQRSSAKLTLAEQRIFATNAEAWEFFSGLAPSYRQKVLYWITSARKAETRASRLQRMIALAAGRRKL